MVALRRPLPPAWLFVGLLMAAVALTCSQATPLPLDDHFLYQRFIETLARGRLDLSIPGFHGSDIFAVPWYLLTRSPIAQIEVMKAWAALLPLFAYLAGRSLYGDRWHGILLAAIIAMMPFASFVSLRGWTGPAFFSFLLLAIALAARRPHWAGLFFGLAIITKPFALALLPLLIVLMPARGSAWIRFRPVTAGLAIAALYLAMQYAQAGRIIVGAHAGLTTGDIVQEPMRIALNLAHAFQILFSMHNYYFPDPAKTGAGNLMHTTPLLVFLGLFGLLSARALYSSKRLANALLLGAAIGIGLNALLDHMDHYYMEAGILLLILAALPVLRAYPLWIPLVLATLHFQWFYFFLEFRGAFALDLFFFAVPALVDILFLGWCLSHARSIAAHFRSASSRGRAALPLFPPA